MRLSRENTVCIAGNGCAAVEAIRALRENAFKGDIHLISDNIWPSYNPMLTTYYIAGKIDFAGLFPFGRGMDFYKEHGVKVRQGSPVVELDAKNKLIRCDGGCRLEYDQCLVATGASPFLPRIPGIRSPKVFAVRTVEDALALREALKDSPKRAVVVGASMVGIKMVEVFHDAGIEVCLADQAPCLFPLAAHPHCAEMIRSLLEKKGIKLRLGAPIQGIDQGSGRLKAWFSGSGEAEEADLIVICIGVRPNLGFINRDQIEADKGILIDDHMRTSDPSVFAAGDVSQGTNILTGRKEIIGLWANARYQGRTAGRNMAGREDRYYGSIPHNITHFMGMLFSGLGDPNGGTREEVRRNDDSYVHLVWKGEKLAGANILGRFTGSGILKNAFGKNLLNLMLSEDHCTRPDILEENMLLRYFTDYM